MSAADNSEIPKALLARHPELAEVARVLTAYRQGQSLEVPCRRCGGPVRVTEVAVTGALVVACDTGCTLFRARRG